MASSPILHACERTPKRSVMSVMVKWILNSSHMTQEGSLNRAGDVLYVQRRQMLNSDLIVRGVVMGVSVAAATIRSVDVLTGHS